MNKKNNILIVHNHYQISGGEDTVVENERKLLEAKGHKVIVYERNNKEINDNLITRLILPFITIFNPKTFSDIKKIINQEKIDIIHVHNTLLLISPSVYYVAARFRIPLVQTLHNFRLICPNGILFRKGKICEECIERGLKQSVIYGCYRNSRLQTALCALSSFIHRNTGIYRKNYYICLTDFNKNKILQINNKRTIIDPEKIFIKPNFSSNYDNIPNNVGKYYIYVGRLEENKGIKVLLDSWKQLNGKTFELIICGEGPLHDYCEDFINKEQLKNIVLKGFVSHDEAMKMISFSKALIFPTKLYEGFPMTITEAFSTGVPVICSDVGNGADLIKDGINGYTFKVGNSESLSEIVKKCDRTNWAKEQIKQKYNDNYSSESNYLKLTDIYLKILELEAGK